MLTRLAVSVAAIAAASPVRAQDISLERRLQDQARLLRDQQAPIEALAWSSTSAFKRVKAEFAQRFMNCLKRRIG
jgi:hypothetical protein